MNASFFFVVAVYLAIIALLTGSRGESSSSFLLAAVFLSFLGLLGLARRGKA